MKLYIQFCMILVHWHVHVYVFMRYMYIAYRYIWIFKALEMFDSLICNSGFSKILWQIFDHIAESLEAFLREENITSTACIPVGKQVLNVIYYHPLKAKICYWVMLRSGCTVICCDCVMFYSNCTSALSVCLCVGFTFSFPSDQKSLKHSVLVTWTKSFKCPDGPGQDACVMLEEAIARRKVSKGKIQYNCTVDMY